MSYICKKASKQLNVSKRIGKYLCKSGKLNDCLSFILSNFNYFPFTWHFCGEVNTKKIEKIQERALRCRTGMIRLTTDAIHIMIQVM